MWRQFDIIHQKPNKYERGGRAVCKQGKWAKQSRKFRKIESKLKQNKVETKAISGVWSITIAAIRLSVPRRWKNTHKKIDTNILYFTHSQQFQQC